MYGLIITFFCALSFGAESYEMITPEVSILSPVEFTLRGQHFDIPYSDGLPGLPIFSVGYNRPIAEFFGQLLVWENRVGYATKSDVFSFKSGNQTLVDTIRLQFIPVMTSLRTSFEIPGFSFGRPSVALGGAFSIVTQRGNIAGTSENFGIPFFTFSPAFTFLEGQNAQDRFGGFTFGVTYFRSLFTRQSIEGWAFDLSAHIIL